MRPQKFYTYTWYEITDVTYFVLASDLRCFPAWCALLKGTPHLPKQPERYQGRDQGEMAGQRTEDPRWPLLLG